MAILLSSLILLGLVIIIPLVFWFTSKLGPSSQNATKNIPYESGILTTIGDSAGKLDVKFYLVAILFIIFDIEIVFMFAWAVNIKQLGIFGLLEMFTFMFLLITGLIYVYDKKALSWR